MQHERAENSTADISFTEKEVVTLKIFILKVLDKKLGICSSNMPLNNLFINMLVCF